VDPPRRMQTVVTSCFHGVWWNLVPAFGQAIHDLSGLRTEVVSLDGLACETEFVSTIHHAKTRVGYGAGDSERMRHILRRLGEGVTCYQIDLDVRLKRDFRPMADLPYDFIISRAFGMPKEVVETLGFIGCTGFYIAKPASAPLLEEILPELGELGVYDQRLLNQRLQHAAWREDRATMDGFEGRIDVCDYKGVSICVLPTEAILRTPDMEASWFGNHHHSFHPHIPG
jgi:hypothetical protein